MRLRTKIWYACTGIWAWTAIILALSGKATALLAVGIAYFYWHAAEVNARVDVNLLLNQAPEEKQ